MKKQTAENKPLMKKKPLTEKQFIKSYNIHDYDVPLVTVDMAIFTVKNDRLHVLIVKRSEHPAKNKWALPGGFIDLTQDRQLIDAAKRKLREKTGIDTSYLEQVETIGNDQRDPRGWSLTVTYFALIPDSHIEVIEGEGSEEINWVAADDIGKEYQLAFDHETILAACYERLKAKAQYTSLPINLLSEYFTLSELQNSFEILLKKPIDKKSFRRRILDADIVEETSKMKTGHSRPAKLYKIKPTGENYYFVRNIEGPR